MPTKAPYRGLDRSLYLTVLEVICVELGRSIPSFDTMGFSKSSHVRARHVPLVNFISLSNHIVMFVVLLVLFETTRFMLNLSLASRNRIINQ